METINKIGRRKAAVARIYLSKGKGKITVNEKDGSVYFPIPTQQYKINQPFAITGTEGQYDLKVNVDGGGTTGQVEAVRMAISRALVEIDPEYKSSLKEHGLMTRDPRMVERKKQGQKKARKKFQFSKR